MKYKLFVVILFITFSCSEIREETKIEVLKKTQLSGQIIDNDLNISYQVPLNWEKMPTSLSDKMVGRVKKNGADEFIVYTPKTFFYNKKNSSLLRIGKIKLKKERSSNPLTIETYENIFKKYNRDLEIKTTNITNSNISIKKIKITKNNLISFKYLFRNNKNEILQFDFSIKEKDLEKFRKSIKASVASIKPL